MSITGTGPIIEYPYIEYEKSNKFLYDQKFIIDDGYISGQVVGIIKLFSRPYDMADGSETFALSGTDAADFDIDSNGVLTVSSSASLSAGDLSVTITGTLYKYAQDTCTITVEVYTLGDVYYVDKSTGSNADTGLTEALAWETLTYALSQVAAGDKVYVKADDYGAEEMTTTTSGTSGNYICIEGYKTTPGDIQNRDETFGWDFVYNDSLDSTEMPLFDGGDRAGGVDCITIDDNEAYILFRNLQFTNYESGIIGAYVDNCEFSNLKFIDFGDLTINQSGVGLVIRNVSEENIYRDLYAENCSSQNFWIDSNNSFLDRLISIADSGATSEAATGYYITLCGSNNYLQNSFTGRYNVLGHTGHGINIQGSAFATLDTQYNTIRHCESIGGAKGIQLRWQDCSYNTVEDCLCNIEAVNTTNGGIHFRDGANNNTVKRTITIGGSASVQFYDTSEDGGLVNAGHDNTLQYCIFRDSDNIIFFENGGVLGTAYDNKFINCIFESGGRLFRAKTPNTDTDMINCIFISIPLYEYTPDAYSPDINYSNCCFYDNSFADSFWDRYNNYRP